MVAVHVHLGPEAHPRSPRVARPGSVALSVWRPCRGPRRARAGCGDAIGVALTRTHMTVLAAFLWLYGRAAGTLARKARPAAGRSPGGHGEGGEELMP